MPEFSISVYSVTTWILPLMVTIILHEIAHGYVAMLLGDKTAYNAGRLTLNPIKHIDPIGTIVLPIILMLTKAPVLFGWAKPVPVNFYNLDKPKRDMGIVALAGPATNFILAIIFALFIRLFFYILPLDSHITFWIIQNLKNGIMISLALGIFNLFPVLPLDGGRIVTALLPEPYSSRWQETERYGFTILMGLLIVLPLIGIDVLRWFMGTLFPYFAQMVNIFLPQL